MLQLGNLKELDKPPTLHKENLDFENVKLTQRSYK